MSKKLGLMICSVCLVMAAEQSSAQVVITPGAINDSASGGAAGARSPGTMVSDGLARARGLRPLPLAPIEITDTATTSARSQLIVDLLNILFRDLNLAIVGVQNAILAQAGRPPVIPASVIPTTTGADGAPAIDLGGAADLISQFSDLLPQGNIGS